MDAQHFDSSAVSSDDFDVGLGYTKRLGDELSQRFVRRAIDRRSRKRDLEGAILNANDAISARPRRNPDLECDRAVLFPNA